MHKSKARHNPAFPVEGIIGQSDHFSQIPEMKSSSLETGPRTAGIGSQR